MHHSGGGDAPSSAVKLHFWGGICNQADCDGQWGEIQLDWEQQAAEIMSLADWDLTKTHPFASKAMEYLLSCAPGKLPKSYLLAFRT